MFTGTIAGLNLYTFNFIGKPEVQAGMMAQEVFEVYPEFVHVGSDDPQTDPWTIDYEGVKSIIGEFSTGVK